MFSVPGDLWSTEGIVGELINLKSVKMTSNHQHASRRASACPLLPIRLLDFILQFGSVPKRRTIPN